MKVVNVISSPRSGGAEVLVKKINQYYTSKYSKRVIYFSCRQSEKLNPSSEICLNISSRSIKAIIKIRNELKKILKEDYKLIVHAHLTWPLFYVAVATIGLKVTLVYTEHSTYNKRRNYSWLKFIERWVYSRYKIIIGISRGSSIALTKWLGSSFNKKIITINNGAELLPTVKRKNLLTNSKLKLLSVGSLKSLKGFETTINCLKSIESFILSYTIVGSGPDLHKLQYLSKACGVQDIVKFVGWSDNPEEFYKDADILLIPSHWEGFSLVAVEGMSTGLPVIASNVEGLNEVVSKELLSTILVDDFKDQEAWSSAIIQMKCKMHTSAKEMGKQSRKQAEKFDLKIMLNAYDELYTTL